MDAVGGASAIIELVKTAFAIIGYIKDVKDATGTRDKLYRGIRHFQDSLEWIQDQHESIEDGHPAAPSFDKLLTRKQDGGWQYGTLLQDADKLFGRIKDKLGVEEEYVEEWWRRQRVKVQKVGKRVAWPIVEASVRRSAQDLERYNQQIYNVITQAHFQLSDEHYELSQRTDQYLQKFGAQYTADMKTLMGRFDRLEHDAADDRLRNEETRLRNLRKDVLKMFDWISPNKFYDPMQNVPENERIPCDWLVNDPVFESWATGRPWQLNLYGEPGYGKTMLSSFIAKHLREASAPSTPSSSPPPYYARHLVLSIFLKEEERESQTLPRLVGSLLRQALTVYDPSDIPPDIFRAWHDATQSQSGLTTAEAWSLLKDEVVKRRITYVIVDGLDEATEYVRTQLVRDLKKLQTSVQQPDCKLALLYTSRPAEGNQEYNFVTCNGCKTERLRVYFQCDVHSNHRENYHLCQNCAKDVKDCDLHEPYKELGLQLRPPDDVIVRYIEKLLYETKVDEDAGSITNKSTFGTTPLGRTLQRNPDAELEKEIVTRIVESAQGSFLLARAQWDHVRNAKRVVEVEDLLDSLPTELNATYQKAMERIKKQGEEASRCGRTLLMWLSYSRRIMKFGELQHALTVDLEHFLRPKPGMPQDRRDRRICNVKDLTDLDAYLAATAGLVHLSDGGIRLMHRSAYEYFKDEKVRETYFGDLGGHGNIALTCMAYVSHTETRTPCESKEEEGDIVDKLNKYPFAAYASQFWGSHAADAQGDADVIKSTTDLLHNESIIRSLVQIAGFYEHRSPIGWDVRKGASAIHLAAWFGLDAVLEICAPTIQEANLTLPGGLGRTPLIYASRNATGKTVARLLALGALINKTDEYEDWPPIRHAVDRGNVDAVRELCRHDELDINSLKPDDNSALMVAASQANSELVYALIQCPAVDVNLMNSWGNSALMYSAMQDSTLALDVLLEAKNVDINAGNKQNFTALHWAAQTGRHEAVDRLLHSKAKAEAREINGFTPLMLAVIAGNGKVVEEYHDHPGVTVQTAVSNNGWTLLHGACFYGHDTIVEWLLKNKAEVNAVDKRNRTSLHLAAGMGHKGTIKLLLDAGADKAIRNDKGQTAAEVAFSEGFFDIANDIDAPPSGGQSRYDVDFLQTTVLAKRGFTEALERRLSETPGSLHEIDQEGCTPLHLAVNYGETECASAILKAGEGQNIVNTPNKSGKSPLWMACKMGKADMVKMLIAHEPEPDLEIADQSGVKPLDVCLEIGDLDAATTLIAAGADLSDKQSLPHGLLSYAITAERKTAVKRLVQRIKTDPADIVLAEQVGNKEIARLLKTHRTWNGRQLSEAEQLDAEAESNLTSPGEELNQDSLLSRLQSADLEAPRGPVRDGPDFSKPAFKTREDPLLA